MKSKSLREVVLTDSPALTAVISYWKEFDKDSVILSYLELKRRNYEIKGNIEKKLSEFSSQQQKGIDELISDYKKENDFENYDEYYSNFKNFLDSEKQTSKIIEKEKNTKKTIFTPINILLFIGLCIGCYIPAKYLIQSLDGTPKCSDEQVKSTVISLLQERGTQIQEENKRLENIITAGKNSELKSCDCQATLPGEYWYISRGYNNKHWENPIIYYSVQKTDDGETMVSVEPNFY